MSVGTLSYLPNINFQILATMCPVPGDGLWLVQAIMIILLSIFQASFAARSVDVSQFCPVRQEEVYGRDAWKKQTSVADTTPSCFALPWVFLPLSGVQCLKLHEVRSQQDDKREDGRRPFLSLHCSMNYSEPPPSGHLLYQILLRCWLGLHQARNYLFFPTGVHYWSRKELTYIQRESDINWGKNMTPGSKPLPGVLFPFLKVSWSE